MYQAADVGRGTDCPWRKNGYQIVPRDREFMKSTFLRFVDLIRSAAWLWVLSAIAVAVLVVFTKALTLVLSLLIWVLVLNGLYHVVLVARGFQTRLLSALVGGIRTIISSVLPS